MKDTGLERGRFLALLGIAFVMTALPIAVSVHPPFLDYINHLARIAILHDFQGVGRFWQPNFVFVPNLGFDLLMSAFAAVLPISIAGKVGCIAIVALFAGGFAALFCEIHRTRSVWALSGFLLVYTYPLMMGFLNFVMGIGLMMLVLAGAIRWRDRVGARVALGVLGGTLVVSSHLMAFLLLFLLGPLLELATGGRLRNVWSFVLPLLVPFGAFLALSPTRNEVGTVITSGRLLKLQALRDLPHTGHAVADYLFVLAVLALVVALLFRRELRVDRGLMAIAGVMLALWLVSPFGFKTTLNVDTRMPMLVGLALFLALAPQGKGVAAGALLGLIGIRGAFLSVVFAGETQAYRVLDRQIAALPSDAILIPVRHVDGTAWDHNRWQPVMAHAAQLGIFQGKFVSGTFDIPTQQLIMIRSEYAALEWAYNDRSSDGRPLDSLKTLRQSLRDTRIPHGPIYLYIMPMSRTGLPATPGLTPVASGRDYVIARFDP